MEEVSLDYHCSGSWVRKAFLDDVLLHMQDDCDIYFSLFPKSMRGAMRGNHEASQKKKEKKKKRYFFANQRMSHKINQYRSGVWANAAGRRNTGDELPDSTIRLVDQLRGEDDLTVTTSISKKERQWTRQHAVLKYNLS